jgi:hypothetical protein
LSLNEGCNLEFFYIKTVATHTVTFTGLLLFFEQRFTFFYWRAMP